MRKLAWLAAILSGLFALGAVHHGIALIAPRESDPSPAWRHLLFVGINAFFSVGFARRWHWLVIPSALLAAQQTYSHGGDVIAAWRAGEWDIVSCGVLLFVPWIVFVAVGLARTSHPGHRTGTGA